tara:strand:+ start:128 stop:643 length:516 start_codon:yes stop_codon:yes gene_type:complete
MNPNLLAVVRHSSGRMPVMLDGVPVPPEAAPFLITSSKKLLWVERAFGEGFLRLGVRETTLGDLFRSLVESIAEEGFKREWGNVLPSTKEGVLKGLAYLHSYDLSDATLLYGDDFDISVAPAIPRVPAEWLPPKWAVMVPSREYVGTAFTFGKGHVSAVVHNASRGVVVLQ